MRRIPNLSAYPTAALFVMIALASLSDAASVDLPPTASTGLAPSYILLAQAPSSPTPAQNTQAPRARTKIKASADDRIDAHIKKLHAKLRITPAQEDLWKNVAKVMRENETTMDALHKSRSEKAETMTAVDDLKSYAEIAAAHAEGLTKFVPVFEALYNVMPGDQRKNADQILSKGK
jgi:hypothetical protein